MACAGVWVVRRLQGPRMLLYCPSTAGLGVPDTCFWCCGGVCSRQALDAGPRCPRTVIPC